MKVFNPNIADSYDSSERGSTSHGRKLRTPTTIDGVVYKIANTQRERDSALRLVYDAYAANGLMTSNASGMRFDLRHLLPLSPIFVATAGREVICTMSLFPDSGMGLVLERHFAHEVGNARGGGTRIAEVSCLASRQGHFAKARMFSVFVNLVGLMFHHAQYSGIQRLLIAVHPRHVRLYQRLLGFEVVGDRRPYGRVNCQPAVACAHDFERARKKSYPLRKHIDKLPFASWELLHKPMTAAERGYFLTENMVLERMKAA